MTVAIPHSLWKRSKFQALHEERDLREIVIEALERYLAEKKGVKHAR